MDLQLVEVNLFTPSGSKRQAQLSAPKSGVQGEMSTYREMMCLVLFKSAGKIVVLTGNEKQW